MKKTMNIALALIMIFALCGHVFAAENKQFPDVPKTHWAYVYVDNLTGMGAIAGMPDGTFAPERDISRAEFTAIIVRALIPQTGNASAGSHWAAIYMQAAIDSKLLLADEFPRDTWDKPIIRQDMAKIIARAMEFVLKEDIVADTDQFTAKITDWASTCGACKPDIAQAYAKGIVSGYPDGSFGGTKNATRAEAAAIAVRLIDKDYRQVMISGVGFNEKVNVAEDGRMKLSKAEEFMMITLQNLNFYKEGSKFYVKGDLPTLPEGFENWLTVEIQYTTASNLPLFYCTTHKLIAGIELPKSGAFIQEITGMTSTAQIDVVRIQIGVNALNKTNSGYEKFEGHYSISSLIKDNISLIDNTKADKVTNKLYDFRELFTW